MTRYGIVEKNKKAGTGYRKRALIIHAVMTCPTLDAAAHKVGVSRSTIDRMIADSEFQRELEAERKRLLRQLGDSLIANANVGTTVMVEMASNPATGDSARITAATKLAELTLRAAQIDQMQREIDWLKTKLGVSDNANAFSGAPQLESSKTSDDGDTQLTDSNQESGWRTFI